MNTDDLYGALSAQVTASVLEHETNNWPAYFEGVRALIRRVVTQTGESGLSDEEKLQLIQRLLDHVASLEEWWVKLKSR
jgi:hypothetical protein